MTSHDHDSDLDRRPADATDAAIERVVDLTWRLRLQPTDPGWVDLAAAAPVMDTTRARDVLGWVAHQDARAALAEILSGIGHGAGTASPVMAPRSPWRRRYRPSDMSG